MNIREWFSSQKPCKRYVDNETLFRGLQQLEDAAIVCIQVKCLPAVRQIARGYGLLNEAAEDILNKSTVILLRKIEEGAYQFQGHATSTYLIEIAKRTALMATRWKSRETESLDDHHHLHDESWEAEKKQQEAAELIRQLLGQLGEPCNEVVRFHHIDGFSDEEVVAQKMTRYTTTNSLKMKRSDCMKVLIQMAQQWKTSINI